MSSPQDTSMIIDSDQESVEQISGSAKSTSTKFNKLKNELQQGSRALSEEYVKRWVIDTEKYRQSKMSAALSTPSMSGLSELSDGNKRDIAGETDINLTIYQLQEMWMQLSSDHTNKEKGMAVLDLLMTGTYGEEIKTETLQLKSRVTGGDIMFDVFNYEGNFQNVLNGFEVSKKDRGLSEFIIAWNALGEDMSQNPSSGKFTPYSAPMVPFNNKERGLGAAISSMPAILSRGGVWIDRHEDGWPEMYTAVTPAGTITLPHEDGKGIGQILVVMHGWNVMMWWEDSDEVREKFRSYHGSTKGDIMVAAVGTWPGLKWACMGPGDYIEMKPGCVHAVISPVNSAISRWVMIQPEWIMDGTLHSGMNEELSTLLERINARSQDDDSLEACIGAVEHDLQRWKEWKRIGGLKETVSHQLDVLIRDVEKKLMDVKNKYTKSLK